MVGLCMLILVWYPPEIIFDCLRSMPIATLSETPRTPHRSPVWPNDNMLEISSTMSGLKTCALDTLWPWFLTQVWGQSYKKSKHLSTLSISLHISPSVLPQKNVLQLREFLILLFDGLLSLELGRHSAEAAFSHAKIRSASLGHYKNLPKSIEFYRYATICRFKADDKCRMCHHSNIILHLSKYMQI